MPVAEMLKTTEAAVVSHVALRDVNRVIDEGILPEAFFSADNGRHVLASACTLISFYFESAERLTSNERLNTIRWAEPRLNEWRELTFSSLVKKDWTMHHDFLTIDLAPFVRKMVERLATLEAARAMVVSSPDILGGAPVIRGTRIPVHDVVASVNAGHSLKDILEAYPVLNAKQVDLAKIYVDANPSRGRPRPVNDLPKGATIITDRRVPRPRKAV
ncbi:DUF433 domain-containing protein [Pararhizobium sp. A13]|uniref:DUF433 domain-containing protein n=1 Tax=Pararhizobium sp. A13 TaxID=3133975 RepID=UPI00311B0EB5